MTYSESHGVDAGAGVLDDAVVLAVGGRLAGHRDDRMAGDPGAIGIADSDFTKALPGVMS